LALRKIALVFILLISPSWLLAQDFDKGFAAYQAGDFDTALQEWRPLAEQGDAMAQYNLGYIYDNGEGGGARSKCLCQKSNQNLSGY
jgi:TPR repeat protein